MTDKELMQMALDALEDMFDDLGPMQHKTIEALRARLAQPEQDDEKGKPMTYWGGLAEPQPDPVAWMHIQGNHEEPSWRKLNEDEISRGWTQKPLYTRLEQPQSQPCNWVVDESAEGNLTMSWMLALPMAVGTKLYTTPQQDDVSEQEYQEKDEKMNRMQVVKEELIKVLVEATEVIQSINSQEDLLNRIDTTLHRARAWKGCVWNS